MYQNAQRLISQPFYLIKKEKYNKLLEQIVRMEMELRTVAKHPYSMATQIILKKYSLRDSIEKAILFGSRDELKKKL